MSRTQTRIFHCCQSGSDDKEQKVSHDNQGLKIAICNFWTSPAFRQQCHCHLCFKWKHREMLRIFFIFVFLLASVCLESIVNISFHSLNVSFIWMEIVESSYLILHVTKQFGFYGLSSFEANFQIWADFLANSSCHTILAISN